MTMTNDIESFAETVGWGFFVIAGYAVKKSKLAYVTIDLFIAVLAYWEKAQ